MKVSGRLLVAGVLGASALFAAAQARSAASATRPSVQITDVSADAVYGGAEPWVAVNPRNPDNAVELWQTVFANGGDLPSRFTDLDVGHWPLDDCRVGATFDGGRTWSHAWSPLTDDLHEVCGDPIAAATPDGVFYVAGLIYVPSTLLGEVRVSRSLDGGHTWSAPVTAVSIHNTLEGLLAGQLYPVVGPSFFPGTPDREWFAVDAATNTIYLSWVDHTDPTGGVTIGADRYFVIASHDDGQSWSGVHPVGPAGQPAYSTIAAADGTLAATYIDTGCGCGVLQTSRDGGEHWSRAAVPGMTGSESGSPGSIPVVAADPSRAGRFAVMAAQAGAYAVHVTTDGGKTWAAPVVLRDGAAGSAIKPWLAYGPSGALGAVWRKIHTDMTQDVYAAVAERGDTTFGTPVKLTPHAQPKDPQAGLLDDVSYVTLTPTSLWASFGGLTADASVRDAWVSTYRFASPAAHTDGVKGAAARRAAGAPAVAAPKGSLAATGLGVGVPLAGLVALVGAALVRRR